MCELLLDQRLPHPSCASDGDSCALAMAAGEGHHQVCHLLLSQPTNPSLANASNSAALVRAAAGGHLEVCSVRHCPLHVTHACCTLFKNVPTSAPPSALCCAAQVCSLLLGQAAHPALANADGSYALTKAAAGGHMEVGTAKTLTASCLISLLYVPPLLRRYAGCC